MRSWSLCGLNGWKILLVDVGLRPRWKRNRVFVWIGAVSAAARVLTAMWAARPGLELNRDRWERIANVTIEPDLWSSDLSVETLCRWRSSREWLLAMVNRR
jgi:hypothetical protein